jgi:hypothetical protein
VIRGDDPEERVRRLLRTRISGPGHMMTYTDLGFLVLWEAASRGRPVSRWTGSSSGGCGGRCG